MNVITRRWIRRHPAPVREFFMTPAEHFEEAGRLAWVVDEEIQSDAKRTLGDLIALARLHLDLACTGPAGDGGHVSPEDGQ